MPSAFFPAELVDEQMPADRASPDDWIGALDDGAPALELEGLGDGGELVRRGLKDGEIVNFMSRTDFGETKLTLTEESWSIDAPMPLGANACCAMDGLQVDTVSGSVEELVESLRELGEDTGEFRISYYAFSDDLPYRFDAATRTFVRIDATAAASSDHRSLFTDY